MSSLDNTAAAGIDPDGFAACHRPQEALVLSYIVSAFAILAPIILHFALDNVDATLFAVPLLISILSTIWISIENRKKVRFGNEGVVLPGLNQGKFIPCTDITSVERRLMKSVFVVIRTKHGDWNSDRAWLGFTDFMKYLRNNGVKVDDQLP